MVYNEPGLVIPLHSLRARVTLTPAPVPVLMAPDLDLELPLASAVAENHPLVQTLYTALEWLLQRDLPAFTYKVSSDIPIKRGMGSGTAISCAIFKALETYYQFAPSDRKAEAFAQQMDTLYHGQPSGIDAAVIAHQRAICFQKTPEGPHSAGPHIEHLRHLPRLHLVIGDTGPARPTAEVVASVAADYTQNPNLPDIVRAIGQEVRQAKDHLIRQDLKAFGECLWRNHGYLQALGVSTPALNQLVDLAREHGALGAKLSGAGMGGVAFALVENEKQAEHLANVWEKHCVKVYACVT